MTRIPDDIQGVITRALKECPGLLRKISTTSSEMNFCARRILFQDINVHSIRRLVHLSSLLSSPSCTIPTRTNTLDLWLAPSRDTGSGAGYDSTTVGDAIAEVLEHFNDVQVSLSLDLPWLISRHMDWGYLRSHTNLRRFVLHGCYPWLQDVADTVPHMRSLESLVVDATFNTDLYDHLLENDVTLPKNLKEISFSPSSLALLDWMASLKRGPKGLHLVRIKVDGVSWHVAFFTGSLAPFLERYGSTVAHLFFWFEECPAEVYNTAGRSLLHAPHLQQLELFLPSVFNEDDARRFTTEVCAWGEYSQVTRSRAGHEIGLGEEIFWDAPSSCRKEGIPCWLVGSEVRM